MSGSSPADRPPTVDRQARDRALLGFLGIPLLALLATEFLLGMALNLYLPVGTGPAAARLSGNGALIAHVIVAVLIVGISSRALVLGVRLRDRGALLGGTVALVGALGASAAGAAFAFGGQETGASFGMSVGFVAVLLGAMVLLARGAPAPGPTRARPGAPGPAGGAGP